MKREEVENIVKEYLSRNTPKEESEEGEGELINSGQLYPIYKGKMTKQDRIEAFAKSLENDPEEKDETQEEKAKEELNPELETKEPEHKKKWKLFQKKTSY